MTVRSPAVSMRMTLCRLEVAGDGDDLSFGADARECFFVQAGRIVVAQLADVARADAPGLTGNDGGCYLAAGLDRAGGILDLGAGLRKLLERN